MILQVSIDSVFSIIQYLFKLSIYYNPYTSTYIINFKDFLFFNNIVPTIYEDIILIKDIFVTVYYKRKKIIEKMMYRFDKKNICNLILKNIVFVPNFYTNIVVINLFRKQRY